MRTRQARETGEQSAEETGTDDRHMLASLDAAAPKNVHGAGERLAREGGIRERGRKLQYGLGRPHVIFGIAVVEEGGDRIALLHIRHARPDGIDNAPALMA